MGCAQFPSQRLTLRVTRHRDDLGSAESLRGDHTAQTHSPVADNDHRVTGLHTRTHGGVVAGSHHVSQRQQARNLLVSDGTGHDHECPVCQRHADPLTLTAVGEAAEPVILAPPSAVQTGRTHPVAAVQAGVVAHVERRDHEVARPHQLNLIPDGIDDADELVPDPVWLVGGRDSAVRPQV